MNDHDAAQTIESGLTWADVSEEERRELDEVFGPEDGFSYALVPGPLRSPPE